MREHYAVELAPEFDDK